MDPMLLEPWLTAHSGVPVDRPFTWQEARELGVTRHRLTSWVRAKLLAHPLRGVYHSAELVDSLDLRLACLRLVVPPDAVVTDRSAAWLLGAPMALAPGDHLVVPRVSVFRPPGYRLRNRLTAGGERTLTPRDVMEVGGIVVTTPLRTACDLGRLLRRDQALAGIDQVLRATGTPVGSVVESTQRYRGFRGVIQLRELAPLADPRSQSPGESICRLRWLDCRDLPRPTPQLAVPGPRGAAVYLDLGVEELRYAVEYDGVEWHGPEHREHDERRRTYLREVRGYLIDVLRAENIHGPHQDADLVIRRGIARARTRRR